MSKTKMIKKKIPEDIINNHCDRDLFYFYFSTFQVSFTSSTCPTCCHFSLPVLEVKAHQSMGYQQTPFPHDIFLKIIVSIKIEYSEEAYH